MQISDSLNIPNFGTEVRNRRIDRDLTQQQLAQLAFIERSEISRIEQGQKIPKLDQMARISKALGVELEIRLRAEGKADHP